MSAPQPRIVVLPNAAAVAEAAATHLVARLGDAPDPPAACLTGGSSPKRLYQLLATPPWRAKIAFDRVQWYIGDDRFVPQSDPLSNMGMARAAFLDACAPAANIHPIDTAAPTIEAAAQRYEDELARLKQRRGAELLFDVVLLGLGLDGHVASLFPGSHALHESRRAAVGIDHADVAPFVPRVSLTLPALAQSREILFIVTGEAKRDIARRALAGEDLPAGRVTGAGEVVWLFDAAAAPPEAT